MAKIPISQKKRPISSLRRRAFLCLDARFIAKFKWLWDDYAGPNETYTGYVSYWDEIPWQRVRFSDGIVRDFNYAAPAQYLPAYGGTGDYLGIFESCVESGLPETYCHNCVGMVGDLIALLEADHIENQRIEAQYTHTAMPREVALHELFFRAFDPANRGCPIVYSRPKTYVFGTPGHIGDNTCQCGLITSARSCDGTEGLRAELDVNYIREFFADAIHYSREFPSSYLPEVSTFSRLVLYIIAGGSVPRVCINGTWHNTSPDYNPPYGDPYGFVYRAHRATIADHGLRFGAGESNEIIIEHVAPRSDALGAQVIFVLEYS